MCQDPTVLQGDALMHNHISIRVYLYLEITLSIYAVLYLYNVLHKAHCTFYIHFSVTRRMHQFTIASKQYSVTGGMI